MLHMKELRLKSGLTQEEIALILRVSQSTYSKYENGQSDIPVEILVEVSKLYGVSVDYLLGITPITKKQ